MIRVHLINGTCINNVSTILPDSSESVRIQERNGTLHIIYLLDIELIETI